MGVFIRLSYLSLFIILVLSTNIVVNSFFADNDAGTAAAKQAAVWNKITGASPSLGPWPTTFQLLKLFIESMDPTIHYYSDEIPSGRQKLIHSVGATAKFHFQWSGAPRYTGLFQSASYGIVRISSAKQWDESKDAEAGSFTPGMGVKLFRTNLPSGNFVAMRALMPQDSWNPFKYTWANHVSHSNLNLALKAIAAKFGTVTAWASHVGTSDLSAYTETGNTVDTPAYPFQLLFVPNADLQHGYSDNFVLSLPDLLAQIPSGTRLYDVYALDTPNENEKASILGSMVLDSQFVQSSYADTTLFFRHQQFEEDIAGRPDWAQYCNDVYKCNVCPLDYNCFA